MAYDKSYARYDAIIQQINLLQNVFERLDNTKISIRDLSGDWIKSVFPAINDQIQILMSISADDIASKYLVMRLNKLNDHLLSENPSFLLAKKLAKYALAAMIRAAQSHSHIWDGVLKRASLTALGSSHITKGRPFYIPEDNKEEEEKKREHKTLEYKPS